MFNNWQITNNRPQIIVGTVVYIVLRLFSYFFQPGHVLNSLISLIILAVVIYLLLKRDKRGWYLVAGEIVLGGIGGFLAVAGLSLRTLLLFCSMAIYLIQAISDKRYSKIISDNKIICYLMLITYIIVAISALRGYFFGHSLRLVFADVVPYLFFLYFFPLKESWQSDKFKKIATNLVITAVIGNLIFVLFTFITYSVGLFWLHDSYYQWFRDIAGGKITDLNNNFYRVILNEQLLLVPLLLYFISRPIIRLSPIVYGPWLDYILASLLIVSLSINLTRIYLLAWLVGLLMLFSLKYWKRWLTISIVSILLLVISFTSIHLITSHGQSLGWELFGLRIQAITKPSLDPSALSRMLLLPEIWQKIKQRPILGHGLGDTITVYSPIMKEKITTAQFDWGYLEIIVEIGLVGLLVWLVFIGHIFSRLNLWKFLKDDQIKSWLAIFVSLLFINITSPALFHVMGIILFTIILTFNPKQYEIKQTII